MQITLVPSNLVLLARASIIPETLASRQLGGRDASFVEQALQAKHPKHCAPGHRQCGHAQAHTWQPRVQNLHQGPWSNLAKELAGGEAVLCLLAWYLAMLDFPRLTFLTKLNRE